MLPPSFSPWTTSLKDLHSEADTYLYNIHSELSTKRYHLSCHVLVEELCKRLNIPKGQFQQRFGLDNWMQLSFLKALKVGGYCTAVVFAVETMQNMLCSW